VAPQGCFRAKDGGLTMSSPCSLRGTAEEINFHRLVCEESPQFGDFFAEDEFARTERSRVALLKWLASFIQQSPVKTQFL
jgi:hypothetical protein